MNKKVKFLPLLLASLLVAQPSSMTAITPLDAAKAFGTGWYKLVTRRTLTSLEFKMVAFPAAGVTFMAGLTLFTYALSKAGKLKHDLLRGILEHDNDLVRQTAPLMLQATLSHFVWIAIYNNNHDALKIILEHGALPDFEPLFWVGTPLCVALVRNDFESAHLLLDHGANPLQTNIRGIKPMDYAYKNEEVARKMRSKIEERESKMADHYDKWYCKKPIDMSPQKSSIIARIKSRLAHLVARKKETT